MNHPDLKEKFQCYYEKLLLSKTVQLVTFIVKDYVTSDFTWNDIWTSIQRVPAARFNNIFLNHVDRHATYRYLQVDLKSFIASRAFFLSREATEGATISQVINSRHC